MTNRILSAAPVLALGAAAMYYLDPERGADRRAKLGDKLASLADNAGQAGSATLQDLANRAQGMWSEAMSAFEAPPADDQLEARVRTAIGHSVRNPHSIVVRAAGGVVTLSGPVLADEVDRLVKDAKAVKGVREVRNTLEVHFKPGRVAGLQGAGKVRKPRVTRAR